MRPFFDTNVLIYAVDKDEHEKSVVADELVRRHLVAGEGMISVQVLREFYSASRRLASPLSDEQAQRMVREFARFRTLPEGAGLVLDAIRRSRELIINFWDALIVEAAISGGADRVLTEDLQHGQVIDCVRIHNPFL